MNLPLPVQFCLVCLSSLYFIITFTIWTHVFYNFQPLLPWEIDMRHLVKLTKDTGLAHFDSLIPSRQVCFDVSFYLSIYRSCQTCVPRKTINCEAIQSEHTSLWLEIFLFLILHGISDNYCKIITIYSHYCDKKYFHQD